MGGMTANEDKNWQRGEGCRLSSVSHSNCLFLCVEVNEPYSSGPGGEGQYTHKVYHVGR